MWNYVETNGNPKEEGFYWCTLLADVVKNGEKTGQKVAYCDSRWFTDITGEVILTKNRMIDQPDKGMVWIRDDDGFTSETVYAWSSDIKSGLSDIPDNVIIINMIPNDD